MKSYKPIMIQGADPGFPVAGRGVPKLLRCETSWYVKKERIGSRLMAGVGLMGTPEAASLDPPM